MPKELHDKLHQQAIEKGLVPNSEPYNRYVYGTLHTIKKDKKKESSELDIDPMPTEESVDHEA